MTGCTMHYVFFALLHSMILYSEKKSVQNFRRFTGLLGLDTNTKVTQQKRNCRFRRKKGNPVRLIEIDNDNDNNRNDDDEDTENDNDNDDDNGNNTGSILHYVS